MISRLIDRLVTPVREGLARGLVRAGLRPNALTVLGMFLTVGAAVAIASGRDAWRSWAVGLLVGAGACDLLDGTVAKVGRLESRFGAILDSVCDRVSDAALYIGLAAYFVMQPDAAGARPNLTLALAALAGLVWAYLISYIKTRAETAGARAGGGFWQRPERIVTILLALAFYHLATAVWILGFWPLTTVAHRLWRARRTAALADAGEGSPDIEPQGLLGLVLWRWKRGGVAFDIHAGIVILMLVFWNAPAPDLLRDLAAWWVGA